MLAGAFRFVCCNGLVVGDVCNDIRIPHKGNAKGEVIEGAFRVLDDFEAVDGSIDDMKSITLKPEEQRAFATAALTLRYGERTEGQPPAPITAGAARITPAHRGPRRQPLARVPARAGEQPAGGSSRSQRARPAYSHPRGGQHRSRRRIESGTVGAGRGDEEAQGVRKPGPSDDGLAT